MKIKYIKIGDYYYPNLTMKQGCKLELSRYGRAKLDYMKRHQKVLYTNLLVNGQLHEYLMDVDRRANDVYDKLLIEYKQQRNITEALKEHDQMQWVQEMNNIINCINEVIYHDYIYN